MKQMDAKEKAREQFAERHKYRMTCKNCFHTWSAINNEIPNVCPYCKKKFWGVIEQERRRYPYV